MTSKIYLDYAAATPMDNRVIKSMEPFLTKTFYNPSAIYVGAREANKALEDARGKVAHWLGSRGSEIIFTAGGTEANNLAIHGIMQSFPETNVVVSEIEHDSILSPASKYDVRLVRVNEFGRLDLDDLQKKIDDSTTLVSIMYANNEIGTIQQLHEISNLIMVIRKQRNNNLPLYFHTDACQAVNYLDLHVSRLGVDMMTLNGGKIYGPKQTGCLFVKSGINLTPIIYGGGQERGLRSGTENVAGFVGFSEAVELTQQSRAEESKRLQRLQRLFLDDISQNGLVYELNGSMKHRTPNNINLTFPGQDNERLIMELDDRGIMVASGSACSASNDKSSHVLQAIGISDSDASSSIRFSMGRFTNDSDIESTTKALKQLVSL